MKRVPYPCKCLQVPRDITEDTLKPLFSPYGEIEHINILRTQRGLSAGKHLVFASLKSNFVDACLSKVRKFRIERDWRIS